MYLSIRHAVLLSCTAFSSIAMSATIDEAVSSYRLGDFKSAFSQFTELSQHNNRKADFWLGKMYERGEGARLDESEATFYYQRAADDGNVRAKRRLELLREGDNSVVLDWYRESAWDGDLDSQFNLGFIYETGMGARIDDVRALQWYEEAANQRHNDAQLRLGLMLLSGVGGEQDIVSGKRWINRSADNGNEVASYIAQNLFSQFDTQDMVQLIRGLRTLEQATTGEMKALLKSSISTRVQLARIESAPRAQKESTTALALLVGRHVQPIAHTALAVESSLPAIIANKVLKTPVDSHRETSQSNTSLNTSEHIETLVKPVDTKQIIALTTHSVLENISPAPIAMLRQVQQVPELVKVQDTNELTILVDEKSNSELILMLLGLLFVSGGIFALKRYARENNPPTILPSFTHKVSETGISTRSDVSVDADKKLPKTPVVQEMSVSSPAESRVETEDLSFIRSLWENSSEQSVNINLGFSASTVTSPLENAPSTVLEHESKLVEEIPILSNQMRDDILTKPVDANQEFVAEKMLDSVEAKNTFTDDYIGNTQKTSSDVLSKFCVDKSAILHVSQIRSDSLVDKLAFHHLLPLQLEDLSLFPAIKTEDLAGDTKLLDLEDEIAAIDKHSSIDFARETMKEINAFEHDDTKTLADASYNIGMMFANGDGAPVNMKLAIRWLEKAVDQGHMQAFSQLAKMYRRKHAQLEAGETVFAEVEKVAI